MIGDIIQSALNFQGYIQRTETYGRSYEWKVAGNPFAGDVFRDQKIMIHLLTKILRRMNLSGWRLVASADVSAKYVNRKNQSPRPLDTHSWFFLKDPDIVLPPGTDGLEVNLETEGQVPEILAEHDSCDSFCGGKRGNCIAWLISIIWFLTIVSVTYYFFKDPITFT